MNPSKIEHLFLPDRGFDRLCSGQGDRLWTADPKAISHILHSDDIWVESPASRELIAILLDRGLVWAEGGVHRRQKKAMAPAFGLSESKALMPRFLLVANKVRGHGGHRRPPMLLSIANFNLQISFHTQLVDKMKDIVANEAFGGSHTLDMWTWTNKATLDA